MENVIIYQHRDFQGASQELNIGRYNVDQLMPNDTLSSLKVPFGLSVELFEHRDFNGIKRNYEYGDHSYVGEDFNDKTSSIIVSNGTILFLSTDDPIVPSSFEGMIGGIFASLTINTSGKIKFDGKLLPNDSEKRYCKFIEYKIPEGKNFTVNEITGNGVSEHKAGWNYSYDNESRILKVIVWVNVRSFLGARNWIGVHIVLI